MPWALVKGEEAEMAKKRILRFTPINGTPPERATKIQEVHSMVRVVEGQNHVDLVYPADPIGELMAQGVLAASKHQHEFRVEEVTE